MSFQPRPKGVRRPKSQAAQREAQPGKAEAARAFKIAVTGGTGTSFEAHHALPLSYLKRAAWDEGLRGEGYWRACYDPRVGLPLARRVHERHTNRVRVIWWHELPIGLRQYVAERWGAQGTLALAREHPSEPRNRPGQTPVVR